MTLMTLVEASKCLLIFKLKKDKPDGGLIEVVFFIILLFIFLANASIIQYVGK